MWRTIIAVGLRPSLPRRQRNNRASSGAPDAFHMSTRLACEQRHSARYQHGGDPSAAVYFFVEEDFCGEGVADEC